MFDCFYIALALYVVRCLLLGVWRLLCVVCCTVFVLLLFVVGGCLSCGGCRSLFGVC